MARERNISQEEQMTELIAAHLREEISAADRERLFAWIREKEEHRAFYEQAVKTWELSASASQHFQVNTEAAWQKVKALTTEAAVSAPKGVLRSLFENPLMRAAAIVPVLFVATWIISLLFFSKPEIITLSVKDGSKMFWLPDSSQVWLNKNSTLQYSSNFMEKGRKVVLEGEAFFDIRKMNGRGFMITTSRSITEVKGTSFKVRSYKNEEEESVEVITGKVSFRSSANISGKMLMLTPGQKGVLTKNQELQLEKRENENSLSWQTQKLVFDNTSMAQVVKDMKDYFGVEVQVTDPKILESRFTAQFDQPTPEQVMEIISATMNLKWKKDQNKFVLSTP